MTDRKAKQTPLPDLLDRVPEDIVLGIPGGESMFPSYTNIPIGRLARDAAAELRRLHAENESLRQIVQDFPPVEAELREVSDRAHRLEDQRDALLAVAQKYIAWSEAENDHKGTTFWERVEMCREVDELARAAIKAVEGEKT